MHTGRLALWVAVCGLGCASAGKGDTARPDMSGSVDSAVFRSPPSTPVVSIEPPSPLTGDDLSWRFDVPPEDPDGDPLSWAVSWWVDGEEQSDLTDAVPSERTALGQVWELRVSVSDGTFTSDTALAVAVIGNTRPVASVVITPEAPTTVDRLRANPSGTDADGDSFGYEILWLVDGSNSGITGPDVPAERTRAGESWSVVVTPVQGGQLGEEATATARILNSSPVVTALRIEPTRPVTDDTLSLRLEGDDPDVDDILRPIYTWTVDGVEVGTAAELDPTAFVRGQEVGVGVAFHDGTVQGPTRYAEAVVIGNSEPALSDVDIEPAAPGPTDTVACRPRGWSDADDDPEAYTYAWALNGASGPTTDTWDLATTEAAVDDVVSCVVTPVDEFSTGVPLVATASVTVP